MDNELLKYELDVWILTKNVLLIFVTLHWTLDAERYKGVHAWLAKL
jgi:hypothetical protein